MHSQANTATKMRDDNNQAQSDTLDQELPNFPMWSPLLYYTAFTNLTDFFHHGNMVLVALCMGQTLNGPSVLQVFIHLNKLHTQIVIFYWFFRLSNRVVSPKVGTETFLSPFTCSFNQSKPCFSSSSTGRVQGAHMLKCQGVWIITKRSSSPRIHPYTESTDPRSAWDCKQNVPKCALWG